MEATLIERSITPQPELEAIDLRTLPKATIRKVIKECFDKGVFKNTPEINRNPLVGHVPWEIAKKYRIRRKRCTRLSDTPLLRSPMRHRSFSNSRENSTTTK